MDKKGHWYTDKNGNHYFVEEGQSPKEGWEQSKRRKMISGGKYMVDEGDGSEPREATKEEYDNYEADESEFDETVDDDFGFDEEEDVARSAEKQNERKLFLKEKGLDSKYELDENGYLIDKAEGTAVLDFNQLDDDFDEVEHQISVYEEDQRDYADEETFYNIRAQYTANGGYFEDLKKEFPDADDELIRGAMNTDINNFDDYLDYRDKKGGWASEEDYEAAIEADGVLPEKDNKNDETIVTFDKKDQWLKDRGFAQNYEFDGGDLIDLRTEDIVATLGKAGSQENMLLAAIESHEKTLEEDLTQRKEKGQIRKHPKFGPQVKHPGDSEFNTIDDEEAEAHLKNGYEKVEYEEGIKKEIGEATKDLDPDDIKKVMGFIRSIIKGKKK